MITTPGQLLINQALPEKYRDYSRTMGKDEADAVLAAIATDDPDKYREVSHALLQLGRNASFDEGMTLRIRDLESPIDRKPYMDIVDRKSREIDAMDATDAEKQELKAELFTSVSDMIAGETLERGVAGNNPFALQVKSKARGNKVQLSALLSTPGTYSDHNGNVIPVFVRNSYAEGLEPDEYWSAAYGGRLGVLCLDPDTSVRMGDWSTRRLGDIRVGDRVMGAGVDGVMEPVTVTAVYDNGVQPVREYSFRKLASRDFVSVKCTCEHKLLARVWKGVPRLLSSPEVLPLSAVRLCKNLDDNAFVACLSSGENRSRVTGISEDRALLLGVMLGDGCTSPSSEGNPTFSCADIELIQDLNQYLSKFGLMLKKLSGSKNFSWSVKNVDGWKPKWSVTVDGRKLNNPNRVWLWNILGNKYAHEKRLPGDVWSWDIASCGDLIAGYTATDGCITRPGNGGRFCISYGSTSKDLLLDVKELLETRFGIWCNPVSKPYTKGRKRPLYLLSISHNESLRRFKDLIPVPGVKKHRLEELDVEPVLARSASLGCRVFHVSDPVMMPTLDIEVDNRDHLFVLANGLIVSNSTKTGTAKGGYLGKLMSAASTEVVVTGEDCETPNGVPVKADDNDNLGSVLARQAGPFAPGTVITRQVLSRLKKDGVEDIAVRSVITCGQEKGVCQKCSGKREGGDFPPLGYALGRVASSALAEQVAQQALNCLAEGTEVMMGDWSVKRIEDIVVGDTVMGCGVDGVARPVLVTATFNNGVRECVETGFVRNSYRVSVLSTPDHKFLASRCVSGNPGSETGFAPAVLPVGTRSRHFYGVPVSRFEGSSIVPNTQMFRRVSQEPVGLLPTYDIEVDHPDHLFVLANGLVCSNSKHSGRKAEGTGFSGFDVIRNLATAPDTYPDRAALSEVDGVVESVSPAPQGGTNIIISGQTHYAIPGMDIYVKPGDSVSAGDTLSNGVVNPADVVRIKGLGEGRRYFMDRFTQAFRESGLGVNRRNVEAVTKAIVDHVELDDDSETGLPGDTVTYSGFASAYRPRTGSSASDPVRAEGKYLEQPYLHYSIGTKVTPSVAGNLKKYGFGEVLVNPDPVPVKPKFVSLVRTPEYVDDWIARMGSSYLNTRLLKDVWSGAESDIHGLNPLPGLARASEFGEPPKGSKSPY